ncbi:SCO2521 family protein [Actinoplanes sp. CA-030573]|uniref:SCO2521 family protein n=1 Tax=Actinoplanes sp. CA-030573 TaxID=3239898 RepID=UPI003D89C0A4
MDTGLLRGRDPSSGDDGESLVRLVAGERVLVSTRPRSYVRSPERPVGVDCAVAGRGAGDRSARGIGTALQRAAITDHEVVQGSAYARIVPADHTARRPWSHYLARPGQIETIGRPRWAEMADALAAPKIARGALDLGAVAQRATNEVQGATRGGREETFRAARSRLRWVAETGGEGIGEVRFEVHDRKVRLLRFRTREADAGRLASICEDVALHDWLLFTLIESVRKAAIGRAPRGDTLARLGPAVDRLLHLWMPAARADELTETMWAVLERGAGFSRQWTTLATRVRDQFLIALAESFAAATRS